MAPAADAGEPHGQCLNCGTRLIGTHCHDCGRSAHVHRTLGAIDHEIAHGVFHVEGRTWRTLPMLLFRPGELTRRYAHGERARFVSPAALFLFIIFVLFAMLSVVGAHLELPDTAGPQAAGARAGLERSIAANAEKEAELGLRRARTTDAAQAERLDRALAELRRETAAMRTTVAAMRPDGLEALAKVHTGWHRLDEGLAHAAENPNLMLYKPQSNAYKFSWALIPLSLPFLWLLFPFSRRITMYDHAVFVTYSLCFVGLLVLALSLLGRLGVGTGTLAIILVAAVPLHQYRQLRGAYRIGRVDALVRTVLLFVAASVATMLFALLLIGLGLVG